MPPSGHESLADVADLLGESALSHDAGSGTLRLHHAGRLGLPDDPAAAGAALLAALDEPGRRQLGQLLSDAGAGDAEVRLASPDRPPRWLRVRVAAGGGAERRGLVADVTGVRQVERALRLLHDGTRSATGLEYLRALVRALAEAVGGSWGLVGSRVPGPVPRIRTRAVWRGGRFLDDFEYELAGTPCGRVLEGPEHQWSAGVACAFPGDRMLAEERIEAYLGTALRGPDAAPVGVLAVMSERPIPPVRDLDALLGIFAARAGAELERLRAEAELQASEARFRQIVTACVEGVAVLDGSGRSLYANPQLVRLLGEPSTEAVLGKSFRDYTDAAGQALVAARLGSGHPGQQARLDIAVRRRDGAEVLVEVAASALATESGRPAGWVALFRDVTEQRALDEQVREAQKLESLGVLAGGVAHDFNNLLAGILANASYAASELPPGSDVRAAVEDVRDAARKASGLTRQLLAYAGRAKLKVGAVDLNGVVAEMAALAAPAMSRRATVVQELAPGLPEVEGDAGQLGQVVMNLLTNASDALAGLAGTVTVRTALARLDRAALTHFHGSEGLPEGSYLTLEVRDDGKGMDATTRQRIFEPFFSTKFAGRGLGLPAALGIVRGHRGAIRVDSEEGRGSRVTVILPPAAVAGEAQARPGAPAPAGAAAGRIAVLVADDEETVRRATRRALEKAGFDVVEAADGREAVERFRAEPGRFGCVLLDVTMPRLGGEEALAEIRQVSAAVPAVLTSGYRDREEAPGEPGGDRVRFLPKPFGPPEVVAAIRGAMGLEAV
jgi:PAS domain S-box-containing protein